MDFLIPEKRSVSKKIMELSDLRLLREKAEARGLKVAHCHGVFDVLHAGHLEYFRSAKKFGEILVVTVTADPFVNKGPGRPYFNSAVRARMIEALEIVDVVAVSQFPTAVQAIEMLRPHFYVKGPDYRDRSSDPTGGIYAEEKAAQKVGGQLVFTDDETHSSSTLVNMFFPVWSDEQQTTISEVKALGGLERIEELIEQMRRESVLVVGEPIVDTYVFCKPEAISSKSPSISARYLFEENHAGGTFAIANHLADFVGQVSLLFTHGDESYCTEVLKNRMDSRVELLGHPLTGVPTPRKTRFIADDQVQRLFEMTNLRSDQWANESPSQFVSSLREHSRRATINIVGDFGHGVFEGEVLQTARELPGFVCTNVQTNSSNFGFNPFTKHQGFNYLSIDLKEARVAYQDRNSSHIQLFEKVASDPISARSAVAMTLGPHGSYFMTQDHSQRYQVPAFATNPIDALGAGDAFFSITSLLAKLEAPGVLIPFLGNIFAGLKTKILGNRSSVSRAQFLKAVTAILK